MSKTISFKLSKTSNLMNLMNKILLHITDNEIRIKNNNNEIIINENGMNINNILHIKEQTITNVDSTNGLIELKSQNNNNITTTNQTQSQQKENTKQEDSNQQESNGVRIINKKNVYLFTIDRKGIAKDLYKLTVHDLYDYEGIQWFEPTADNYYNKFFNYHRLLDVNEKLNNKKAWEDQGVLYFTWRDIVDFANSLYKDPKNDYELAKNSLQYLSKKGIENNKALSLLLPSSAGNGDWKAVKNGAREYLLVSMEGIPYWANAIGQIPYAINTYRGFYYLTRDKQAAKNATINMGYAVPKGDIDWDLIQTAWEYGGIGFNNEKLDVNFKFKDTLYQVKNKNELPPDSNSYDNKMILRAVNWAANHSNNISMLSLDSTGSKIYDK